MYSTILFPGCIMSTSEDSSHDSDVQIVVDVPADPDVVEILSSDDEEILDAPQEEAAELDPKEDVE